MNAALPAGALALTDVLGHCHTDEKGDCKGREVDVYLHVV